MSISEIFESGNCICQLLNSSTLSIETDEQCIWLIDAEPKSSFQLLHKNAFEDTENAVYDVWMSMFHQDSVDSLFILHLLNTILHFFLLWQNWIIKDDWTFEDYSSAESKDMICWISDYEVVEDQWWKRHSQFSDHHESQRSILNQRWLLMLIETSA